VYVCAVSPQQLRFSSYQLHFLALVDPYCTARGSGIVGKKLFRDLRLSVTRARSDRDRDLSSGRMIEPRLPIIRRRVHFDFNAKPPSPQSPGWVAVKALFDAASISFPPAERFAIAAVVVYRARITDPVLRQHVAGFLQQEAMHCRMHADLNATLALSNPNCQRAARIVDRTFQVLCWMPQVLRLSTSAGMEHIAALLADVVLRHAEALYMILPAQVADMWILHAIEETEHKSVCFDVHRTAAGAGGLAYLNRLAGMTVATPVFLLVMLVLCTAVLRVEQPADATPTSGDAPLSRRGSLGVIWSLIPWNLYFSYFRWSFHPWQHDNSKLVTDWMIHHPDFGMPKSAPAQECPPL
jgi:uncharacterized protein